MKRAQIEEQNRYLLRRQREFRQAADVVTQSWMAFPEIEAIAVIGSVAKPLWKEVPRFSEFRRARVEVWHERRSRSGGVDRLATSARRVAPRGSRLTAKGLRGRRGHQRRQPSARRIPVRARQRPLLWPALFLQPMSERKGRLSGSRLRSDTLQQAYFGFPTLRRPPGTRPLFDALPAGCRLAAFRARLAECR